MKSAAFLKPFALSMAVITMMSVMPLALAASSDNGDDETDMAPSSAPSQGGQYHGGHQQKAQYMRQCAEDTSSLGLSPAQQTKLKSLKASFRQDNQSTFDDMKATRSQLRQLSQDRTGNAEQIQQLHQQLRSDMQTLKGKSEQMLQSVLTPQQFQQYKAQLQSCKQQMRGNGQGWHHTQSGGGES